MDTKVAIVTGASSEIGLQTIRLLIDAGYVVYALSRSSTGLKGKNINNIILDINNSDDVNKFIKGFCKSEVDLLINIAGVTRSGDSLSFSEDEFKTTLETNLIAPFRLIKGFYPYFKKKGGRIVNITSLNGIISLPNFGIYSASKFALNALGNALFYELRKDDIFVTNIIPGAVIKDDNKGLSHKPAREKFIILKLLMPMITPMHVAETIVKIARVKKPPSEILLGNDTKILNFLRRYLPLRLWEKIMLYIWQK